MKLAIVIAAYNEAKSIERVLSSLPKSLPGISKITPVVVNDGSADATGLISSKISGVKVINHPINRGQGAALKTGFDYALSHDYDIAVTFDADGQHRADEIGDLVAPIVNGRAEAVLGSRFLGKKPTNIDGFRRLVLKGGVLFTRLVSHIKVSDTHNGFRAFSRQALAKMRLHQDGMEHASEILDQIHRQQIKFLEVPVTIEYTDLTRQKGQRNANALKIAAKMLVYKITR